MGNLQVEEDWIIGLILYGGNARSLAMQAIDQAADGHYKDSDQLMNQANEAISKAHEYQHFLTQQSIAEPELSSPLLLMHGQDHLMSAITVIDLAERMILLYQRLEKGGI